MIQVRLLKSKVAQRIVLLFIISAIVPVSLLAGIAYRQVTGELEKQARKELHRDAKTFGVMLFERFEALNHYLATLSHAVAPSALPGIIEMSGDERFLSLRLRDRSQPLLRNVSPTSLPVFSAEERKHLHGDKSLLSIVHDAGDSHLFLSREVPGTTRELDLVAEINPQVLWKLPVDETHTLCLLDKDNRPLHCTKNLPVSVYRATSRGLETGISGALPWMSNGEAQLGYYWSLFTRAEFYNPNLTVVLSQPRDLIFEAIKKFSSIFPIIVIGTILLVVLLSMSQVRRYLIPLEKLRAGTQKVTSGNFDAQVEIQSGDEFEELGHSFNNMANRLERQFDTIETLAEIDRLILSSTDKRYIIETLLRRIPELIPCQRVFVFVRNHDATGPNILYLNSSRELVSTEFLLDDELDVLLSGTTRPVFIESVNATFPAQALSLENTTRFACYPIEVENEVAAAVVLAESAAAIPGAEDYDLVAGLADRTTVALSNAAWEEKLYHQAHYDALTNLPNRALLKDRLDQAIQRASRNETRVAIMFIDLDRFKKVNDTLGHGVGDVLLRKAAERLQSCVRDMDTVVRFGGDEFIIVVPDVPSDGNVTSRVGRIAETLLVANLRPIEVAGHQLHVTSSIGISLFPQDASNSEDLIKNADSAMYHAKAVGRDTYQFFAEDLNVNAALHLDMEKHLHTAIADDEMLLLFQPKVDIQSQCVTGAECLLRWMDPVHGMVLPELFLSVAEESGLISQINEWVLRTACAQLVLWRLQGLQPIRLSINLSASQFHSRHLIRLITQVLDDSGIDANCLELEITESTLMGDINRALPTLAQLAELGVCITIDNFGTGYSSLAYLAQLPISTLKIDRTFVRDILTRNEVRSIVSAIVSLSRSLGVRVVAEGVEDLNQLKLLTALGCDEVQGYLVGKPMNASDLSRRIIQMRQDTNVAQSVDSQLPPRSEFHGPQIPRTPKQIWGVENS